MESDDKYVVRIESLEKQIDLFLVKSTFESVSNIQHQDGTYKYGKRVLEIEGELNALTIGLSALSGIEQEKIRSQKLAADKLAEQQRNAEKEAELKAKEKEQELKEKHDSAINLGLAVFGFIVVISTLIDTVNFADWFYAGNVLKIGHIVLLGIVAVLDLFMEIVLIANNRKRKNNL